MALGVKRTEVMFAIGVVGVAEVVEDGNRPDNPSHGGRAKSRDPRRDGGHAQPHILSQGIIERAYPFLPVRHDGLLSIC
ncbi:MAG: hypothetical protein BGP08_06415 [Rhizobiales bacterium 64-17]|nr:MAG: hypothetical protein BGP08_06415 [Rhizobiales bacterium 64-17]